MNLQQFQDLNRNWGFEGFLTQEDLDRVSGITKRMESRGNDTPQNGDIVICKKGEEVKQANGHIEKADWTGRIGEMTICTSAYVPFVNEVSLNLSTSGGYWVRVKKEDLSRFKYIGKKKKMFHMWQRTMRAAGAMYFEVTVNVWEYSDEYFY